MTGEQDGAAPVAPFHTEACRSCDAPIIWAVTLNGKPTLVDAEPAADGTVALERINGRVLARVLPVAKRFGRRDLRLSHFVRCPQAKQWRKR